MTSIPKRRPPNSEKCPICHRMRGRHKASCAYRSVRRPTTPRDDSPLPSGAANLVTVLCVVFLVAALVVFAMAVRR